DVGTHRVLIGGSTVDVVEERTWEPAASQFPVVADRRGSEAHRAIRCETHVCLLSRFSSTLSLGRCGHETKGRKHPSRRDGSFYAFRHASHSMQNRSCRPKGNVEGVAARAAAVVTETAVE